MKPPGENLESPFLDQEILVPESEAEAMAPVGLPILEYKVVAEQLQEAPEEEAEEDEEAAIAGYELVISDVEPRADETFGPADEAEAEWEDGEPAEVEEADLEFAEEFEETEEDEFVRLVPKDVAARRGDPESELEDEDSTPGLEFEGAQNTAFTAQATDRYVLLVSGYNFREHNDGYDELARNRARVIVSKSKFKKDDTLVFVWFSFAAGRVFVNRRKNGVWKLRNTADWTPINEFKFDATHSQTFSFEAIDRTRHYGTGRTFLQNDPNTVMSIVHVYEFILNLGRHRAASLLEFSILSHGTWKGPVLVNSNDNAAAGSQSRDPSDKDGRGRKDFLAVNINTSLVHDAFHDDGFSWIWGCFVSPAPRAVIQGVADSRFKKTPWGKKVKGVGGAVYRADGKTPDTAKFLFSFGKDQTEEYSRTWDPAFFPTGKESFEKTFAEIKEFAKRHSDDTYCYALTLVSDKPCFGPPVGTSTNYAKVDPYRPGTPVVHWVERGKKRPAGEDGFEANYSATINFFVKTMNMPEDPENRGYVRFSL